MKKRRIPILISVIAGAVAQEIVSIISGKDQRAVLPVVAIIVYILIVVYIDVSARIKLSKQIKDEENKEEELLDHF